MARSNQYPAFDSKPYDSEEQEVVTAAIAQLGERQTEDLKVPGSIPGLGTFCLTRDIA